MEKRIVAVQPHVELLTVTPNPERHIELCGREAYGSAQAPTLESCRDWIRKRIAGGEPDVIEHAVLTIRITCSRVVSHELVRHRLAAYTQRSQRFTEKGINEIVVPVDWPPDRVDELLADYQEAYEKYLKWRAAGIKRQDARYILPTGNATRVVATWNFRQARHVLTMRMPKAAQPEFRVLARAMWEMLATEWSSCFEDLDVAAAA